MKKIFIFLLGIQICFVSCSESQKQKKYSKFSKLLALGQCQEMKSFIDSLPTNEKGKFINIGLYESSGFYQNLDLVKLFIRIGANVNIKGESGDTLIFKAARKNNKEIVEYLIIKNADLKAVNEYGHTPLTALILNKGDVKIAQLLIKNKAEINYVTPQGQTPLIIAAQENSVGLVKLLLDYSADVNTEDKNGDSALEKAIWHNNTEIAKLLLNVPNINVNTYDFKKDTPLINAIENNNYTIVKLLLEKGASLKKDDNSGKSVVEFAKKKRNKQIIELIQDSLEKQKSE